MIKFILNNKEISTDLPPGMLVLDFVRYHKHLTGTKIGCREGDCGACTVLVGEIKDNEVAYKSFTSCLTPLGNVHGKHVVTIEGINMKQLNPVQQAMTDCSATQCGFCTPGFVVSLAGFCLSRKEATTENAINAIDGNICRCTGYKSIERAAAKVTELLVEKKDNDPLVFVSENSILPKYFKEIKSKLQSLGATLNNDLAPSNDEAIFVGGGTDLYVQKHEEMKHAAIHFVYNKNEWNSVSLEGNKCIIGSSVTVTDLLESKIFIQYFPGFEKHVKLVSSTPIRNMATIAGNFVNASPIGDFTIFFLALGATIVLSDGRLSRTMPLKNFYLGYKKLDKKSEEFIKQIEFELPTINHLFNFEKVSKRTHLDIASVNTAIMIKTDRDAIVESSISAGGVGPIPMFLAKASSFLIGKHLSEKLIADVIEVAQSEIVPISDARGQAAYKRFLLGQLIKAHFISLFPKLNVEVLLSH